MNHAPAILAAPALIYSMHRLLVVWITVAHFHLCSLLDRYIGITDFSYPRPFVPKYEKSLWRTFVPWGRKFSIGTFRSWERKVLGRVRRPMRGLLGV